MFKLFNFIFETPSNSLLVGMGFPKVIASILIDEFGKNTFIIAKWLKDYETGESPVDSNWWKTIKRSAFSSPINLNSLVAAYEALEKGSFEDYHDAINSHRTWPKSYNFEDYKDKDIEQLKRVLKDTIKDELFNSTFFSGFGNSFIAGIRSGKITDLKPYKDLSYRQAIDKFDKKNLFRDVGNLVKKYENGWRWIDAGKKCMLVGNQMRNCGSASIMSSDEDRTLMVLFNPKNEAKVIVTYSPNEKKLSSAEGQASTEPKDKYHDYILDLEDVLNAKYDYAKDTRGKALNIKTMFKPFLSSIERIGRNTYEEMFKIKLNDGQEFYTDSFYAYPVKEVDQLFSQQTNHKSMFDFLRADIFSIYSKHGIPKIDLYQLKHKLENR